MNLENFLFVIGILILVHAFFCISYSKEIYYWVPTIKHKIFLLVILWLMPIIGVVYVHRHRLFKHMRGYKEGNAEEGNAISSGMLEIDSVFNPGARHFIEAVKEQKVIHQEQTKKNKNEGLKGMGNLICVENNKHES